MRILHKQEPTRQLFTHTNTNTHKNILKKPKLYTKSTLYNTYTQTHQHTTHTLRYLEEERDDVRGTNQSERACALVCVFVGEIHMCVWNRRRASAGYCAAQTSGQTRTRWLPNRNWTEPNGISESERRMKDAHNNCNNTAQIVRRGVTVHMSTEIVDSEHRISRTEWQQRISSHHPQSIPRRWLKSGMLSVNLALPPYHDGCARNKWKMCCWIVCVSCCLSQSRLLWLFDYCADSCLNWGAKIAHIRIESMTTTRCEWLDGP